MFRRIGITFAVYVDAASTERLIPFDVIPRILTNDEWVIDRWQLAEGINPAPFALLSESAHGPQIAAINAAARSAGVQVGVMLTDARALCPDLAVHPGDPAGDRAFLEKLALWAQRWGPWSALDPPDGLLVDVTGVAHQFGGERGLLDDAAARLAARGLSVRLAIAPTAGAAWALAHYGGAGEAMLDQLPVAALRLDPATLLVLRRLGLKRVADLSGVARDALARRFRDEAGWLNQRIAAVADCVVFIAAGLPMTLKG